VLAVCATPIGNLEDVTLRVLRELAEADLVLCEDTRHTRRLLERHGIRARLRSYHEHNEAARTAELMPRLQGGERIALVSDAGLPGIPELLRAVTQFTTLDDGRQPFRMVWVSRKLTENNLALDAAEQLARRALAMADAATEPNGSMRDAPLLDREGRRAVFMGRAYDALGWVQFKKGNTAAAVESLLKSVEVYPQSGERKAAMWHLAVAMQEAGDNRRALDFYIASYEPEAPTAGVRRAQIEALYRKVNGSLTGLEEKLKQP